MMNRRELTILVILVMVSILLTAWIDPWHDAVREQDPYPPPATTVVIEPYPGPEATATPKAKPEKYQPKPTEDTGWRPTSPPDD